MTFFAARVYRLGDGVGWFYTAQGLTGAAVLLWAAGRIQRQPTRRQLAILGLSCVGEELATIAFGLDQESMPLSPARRRPPPPMSSTAR
ncbi:hypothetical protein [Micromonospora sp. KC213]|uniref:hypothetical protein n=1 Tax=Micromonospora sp. KC213 TaxID=2530378 RepID=UPI0010448B7C|nr:hypothetical protein [Micromonospora sp. KC213]TDC38631.1 hypothetical protein E1166_18065 [Micromonospora sp. KC213]